SNIPSHPDRTYAGRGWRGWDYFLGKKRRRFGGWWPFNKACAYARSLRIKTMKEYQEHWRTHKLPDGFPYSANRVYAKKGWKGWPHFLGYDGSLDGIKARRWLPFEQVRAYARRQGLRSCHDWIKHKRPDGMPSHPEMIYAKKGWKGWPN